MTSKKESSRAVPQGENEGTADMNSIAIPWEVKNDIAVRIAMVPYVFNLVSGNLLPLNKPCSYYKEEAITYM